MLTSLKLSTCMGWCYPYSAQWLLPCWFPQCCLHHSSVDLLCRETGVQPAWLYRGNLITKSNQTSDVPIWTITADLPGIMQYFQYWDQEFLRTTRVIPLAGTRKQTCQVPDIGDQDKNATGRNSGVFAVISHCHICHLSDHKPTQVALPTTRSILSPPIHAIIAVKSR